MKISSDPNHSAYHHAVDVCRIYLEGAQRNNVITADEEGRFAVTMRLDEFGNPMHKGGKLLTDPFYGAVRIECPEWVRAEREGKGWFGDGVITFTYSGGQTFSVGSP